jgi:hypothetical protein
MILGLITTLALFNFISCSDDNEVKENSSNKRISKVLNQENVYNFVKKHVELNAKIIFILENEPKLNNEILFKYASENCTNEDEFKNILQKSGIVKINELSELISLQIQNSKKFQSNSPDFFRLNKLEQNKLITKYVDKELNKKLIKQNSENNNLSKIASCATDFNTARERCERDLNLHGAFAIAGCLAGPWACAGSLLLAGAEHANCQRDAKADFDACLK